MNDVAEIASRPRRELRTHCALIVLTGIVCIAALYGARAFVVPVLIGILISYALRPVVDRLEVVRLPRPVAAALVLLALIGGLGWIVYSLGEEASVMLNTLPDAARKLRLGFSTDRNASPTTLQNMQDVANELGGTAADVRAPVGEHTPAAHKPEPTAWLRDYAVAQSTVLMGVAAQAPAVLLLAYFVLASGAHFRRKLVQFVGPSLARKKDTLRILGEIDSQVQRYLFVMRLSNVLIGVATWVALKRLGLEHAGVWGFAVGVLDVVPYLGTTVVALAAGIAAFLQFGTLTLALAAAGAIILIAGVVDHVFVSWLHSRFARVNAAVLFIALLFFGWLWGIAGLLLSAPLVAIGKVICDRVESLKSVGELLGR